jgi:transcriptional regulator with XRE-family HTH domain
MRMRRKEAGLTLAQLASAVGVSVRQIVNYEQGSHSPSPARLKQLATALNTSPQVLAGVPDGEETLRDLRRFAGLDRAQAARRLAQILPGDSIKATAWKLQAVESGTEILAWKNPTALREIIPALSALYGCPSPTVRLSWFRAFPHQAHLLRAEAGRTTDPRPRNTSATAAWAQLSERQRAYLAACFREDQAVEAQVRAERAAHEGARLASQWRKLPFTIKADPALTGYTRIQEALRRDGWHDAGAGATLHALARRGLITVSEDEVEVLLLGFVRRVLVELTRRGRACARAGTGETAARPPKDLLSQWLWRSLVKVAAAGDRGLPREELWGRAKFYLGTGYRPHGAMSRGFIAIEEIWEGSGDQAHVTGYRWKVTDAGRRHITRHLETYRRLYPEVSLSTLRPV